MISGFYALRLLRDVPFFPSAQILFKAPLTSHCGVFFCKKNGPQQKLYSLQPRSSMIVFLRNFFFEQQCNCPKTGKTHYRKNYSRNKCQLASENRADNIYAEKTDGAPVKRSDNNKYKCCIIQLNQLLKKYIGADLKFNRKKIFYTCFTQFRGGPQAHVQELLHPQTQDRFPQALRLQFLLLLLRTALKAWLCTLPSPRLQHSGLLP